MKYIQWLWARRNAKLVIGGLLLFFVLVNLVIFSWYQHRTYPHTTAMGVPVGSVGANELKKKMQSASLPQQLQLAYGLQRTTVQPATLGVVPDTENIARNLRADRTWLPIANLFMHHRLPAPVMINDVALAQAAQQLGKTFYASPTPAHLIWNGKAYQAVQAHAGYELDTAKLKSVVLASLRANRTNIAVPTKPVEPSVLLTKLDTWPQKLQGQLGISLTYHYSGQAIQPSPTEKAAWFTQSGDSLVLSTTGLQAYLSSLANRFGATNSTEATVSTLNAITDGRALDFTLVRFNQTKTYTYCTAVRGVNASYLPELQARLYTTYNDARSWSLNGQVSFQYATRGCDYTVWLVSSDQMSSFGAICDPVWSCTIGSNVVINFDRWEHATDTWNAARAGSIDEYRSMAINHETGHELGFGHATCPARGSPAPVMEQQSIDLQGCTFNAWPLSTERDALRRKLGL